MGDDALCEEQAGRHDAIDGKVIELRPFSRRRGSDPIRLQIGERPWLPTPDTRVVEIYEECDPPTAGLIEQDGRLYVFDCIDGRGSKVSFWAYTQVDAIEVSRLQNAAGDDLIRLLDALFADRPSMAALVFDNLIESSAPINC